jgi:hypothetical protein
MLSPFKACQTIAVCDMSVSCTGTASGRLFVPGRSRRSVALFSTSGITDQFNGLVSLVEYTVHLIGRDKNDVAGLEGYLSILMPDSCRAFKYKYLVLPIVRWSGVCPVLSRRHTL